MTRDHWNYFVGDSEYKTDPFLRFSNSFIKGQYQKHLIASSAYSLRILLVLLQIIHIAHVENENHFNNNYF